MDGGEDWVFQIFTTSNPSPPPPASHLKMPPEATTLSVAESLISPFRSTKSMKIPLEILMCVTELASPSTPQTIPNPPRMIQLLNINSVWHRAVGFKVDSGFLQRGVREVFCLFIYFPNACNTSN